MENHDKNLACIILELVVIGYIPVKTTVSKRNYFGQIIVSPPHNSSINITIMGSLPVGCNVSNIFKANHFGTFLAQSISIINWQYLNISETCLCS